MGAETGQLVLSLAGRDRGGLFCVTGRQGEWLLLADGKRRRISAPKRKKPRHVQAVDTEGFTHPALEALGRGEPITDRSLRRALAAFREARRV